MWNEVFTEHKQASPKCGGKLHCDLDSEEQVGLCWKERIVCSKCKYTSKFYKLYAETRTGTRGPPAASPNCGVQVGLSQTPIGNLNMRKLCLSANLPAPSASGMQKKASQISKIIENENKKDMKKQLQHAKKIHQIAQGTSDSSIPMEGDGCYNNPLYSAVGKTPYQPATQVTYVVAEGVTRKRSVVSLCAKSKLCPIGARKNHSCPDHDGDCIADLKSSDTVGNEEKWATECLEDIAEQGVSVSRFTTDPDSKAFLGAEKLYREGRVSNRPEHRLDTRHVSDNQRKSINKTEFSANMFPGRTKEIRKKLQRRFAIDVSKRCTTEVSMSQSKNAGDFNSVKREMSHTTNAIADCYKGDHRLCKKYSYACKGEAGKTWMNRTRYLAKDFKVKCTKGDKDKLAKCIDVRLSQKVLNLTKENSNSQKAEATNRCLRRSLPRSTTFSRTFKGRAHSAIHSVNNGPGDSIKMLCSAVGCDIPENTRVSRALDAMQKANNQRKTYAKTPKAKKARERKISRFYESYDAVADSRKKGNRTYAKGMLLPNPAGPDHSYIKK